MYRYMCIGALILTCLNYFSFLYLFSRVCPLLLINLESQIRTTIRLVLCPIGLMWYKFTTTFRLAQRRSFLAHRYRIDKDTRYRLIAHPQAEASQPGRD